jgi:hypothetical protein
MGFNPIPFLWKSPQGLSMEDPEDVCVYAAQGPLSRDSAKTGE